MRKLIHLAYGVLKTGKPFDPEWLKLDTKRLTRNTVSNGRGDTETSLQVSG